MPPITTSADRRAVRLVLLIAGLLAAAAVALVTSGNAPGGAAYPAPWWTAAMIAIAFGVAEHYVFHIEYRREAISFSLSEVPTAFALVFLGPVVAIAVRVIGSLAVISTTSRPAPHKLVFNGALFAFEAALAFTVVRRIVPVDEMVGGRFLVAVAVGVAAATFIGSVVVSVAIACFEGDLRARLFSEIETSAITGPVSAAVAAVAVAPALFGLELAVLSFVPVAAVWWVLLRHGRLDQRHRDLEGLHGFAGVVGRSIDLDDVAPAALDEALRLLRAERGALQVYDASGHVVIGHSSGEPIDGLPNGPTDARWSDVFAVGGAVGWQPGDGGAVVVGRTGPCTRIAVPVRDGRGLVGMLAVAERSGVTETFDDNDLDRASRLGEQLAVGLRNATLHADMERAALTDGLTGEHNRTAFDQLVGAALAEIGPSEVAAVMVLDLDRFKEVNDTLGHQVGDRVLVEFARRLREVLDPGDVFARFGGDEFAVFVRRPDLDAVRHVAQQILWGAYAPLTLDGFDIVVAVSVGMAPALPTDANATSILRRADVAMYAAKRQHSGFETYREDLDRSTPARLSLLGDLRDALEHGEVGVHFQPKIDLASGRVVGAEALARWYHATRGWVEPSEFIPVAEESGLIKQLTDQVLSLGLRGARRWLDRGYDLSVAVNLSSLDLLDELLPERIALKLREYRIEPSRLTLEITESSLMADIPRTMSTVASLHQLGVKLSLDDFGTGYSSLSYLRRLPVTELKIDRSFVIDLAENSQDEVIVRSTIDLGHHLGLRVVAEGIETDAAADRLRELGCDLGQGYGIARPLDQEHFVEWLGTYPGATACSAGSALPRLTAVDDELQNTRPNLRLVL